MILKVRIDERLIHGEIVYSWRGVIQFDSIVIASDSVAQDELRKTALRMGCPADIKVAIRSVEDAAKLLTDPRMEKYRTLVLCQSPLSALRLYQKIEQRPGLNIGYMQPDAATGRKELTKGVHVTKEELESIFEIRSMGVGVDLQRVPTQPAINFDRAVERIHF